MHERSTHIVLEASPPADIIPDEARHVGARALEKRERGRELLSFHESRLDGEGGGTIRVGLIDPYAFTRECIWRALQERNQSFIVTLFADLAEAQRARNEIDVLLVHWQGSERDGDGLELELIAINEAIGLGHVLMLSNIADPTVIRYAFSKGVRGYVTTAETSVNLLGEIIRLIKAGGTFVPVIGLPLNAASPQDGFVNDADQIFTAREKAVLNLLKTGKANKLIAYELAMS